MERFSALSRGAQLMFIGSILLLIDSFLSWQSYDGPGSEFAEQLGVSDELSRNAWHGVGVIMGLLVIVLIAWLVVRLAAADVKLPVSDAMTGAVLGILILIFTIIKILADNEYRTIWAWVGLGLAVVIAVGAWMSVQEAGGVNTLKSEATSMTGSGRRRRRSANRASGRSSDASPGSRSSGGSRGSRSSGRARSARPFRRGTHTRRRRPPGLAEPARPALPKAAQPGRFRYPGMSTRRPRSRRRPSPAVPRRGR